MLQPAGGAANDAVAPTGRPDGSDVWVDPLRGRRDGPRPPTDLAFRARDGLGILATADGDPDGARVRSFLRGRLPPRRRFAPLFHPRAFLLAWHIFSCWKEISSFRWSDSDSRSESRLSDSISGSPSRYWIPALINTAKAFSNQFGSSSASGRI